MKRRQLLRTAGGIGALGAAGTGALLASSGGVAAQKVESDDSVSGDAIVGTGEVNEVYLSASGMFTWEELPSHPTEATVALAVEEPSGGYTNIAVSTFEGLQKKTTATGWFPFGEADDRPVVGPVTKYTGYDPDDFEPEEGQEARRTVLNTMVQIVMSTKEHGDYDCKSNHEIPVIIKQGKDGEIRQKVEVSGSVDTQRPNVECVSDGCKTTKKKGGRKEAHKNNSSH